MTALPQGFTSFVTNIGIKDTSDDFTVVAADTVVAIELAVAVAVEVIITTFVTLPIRYCTFCMTASSGLG